MNEIKKIFDDLKSALTNWYSANQGKFTTIEQTLANAALAWLEAHILSKL